MSDWEETISYLSTIFGALLGYWIFTMHNCPETQPRWVRWIVSKFPRRSKK